MTYHAVVTFLFFVAHNLVLRASHLTTPQVFFTNTFVDVLCISIKKTVEILACRLFPEHFLLSATSTRVFITQ